MSRPVCARKIPGGTCAELQGHKSRCWTADERTEFWNRSAFVDILRLADRVHGNFLADLYENGHLTGDQWQALNNDWESKIPQLYAAAGRSSTKEP